MGETWILLNNIEKNIKEKIIGLGTPLKEWGLKINRGVLTGFNEAFIVNKQTKDMLIDQDAKSADLITPILRGRDIRRYGYNFSNNYLISTFPSRSICIDEYPAIRDYLLSFGREKLEQSGLRDLNGTKGNNARKKTANKWYETQDTIAYWEDFSKQKIIYPETTQEARFAIDNSGHFIDKTAFTLISKVSYYLPYLQATLSSKLFEYGYKRLFSSIELGKKGYQYNKHALLLLPIIKPESIPSQLILDIESNTAELSKRKNNLIEKQIDDLIFDLYSISTTERNFIISKY